MNKLARNVAVGGLLTALGWLFLVLTFVLPTGRLFLLTFTSFIVLIACTELSYRYALAIILAIAGLSTVYPGLLLTLFFILFFGPAPLISLFLARHFNGLPLLLSRHAILTALIAASLAFVGLDSLVDLPAGLGTSLVWFLAIAVIQVFLFFYDYLLRAFSRLWVERIRPGTRFR